MSTQEDDNFEDIYEKYKKKINSQFDPSFENVDKSKIISTEYLQFKNEFMPKHFTLYEKLCQIAEKTVKIAPDKNKTKTIAKNLEICHLKTTPAGVTSFSMLFPILFILLGSLISAGICTALGISPMFFILFFVIAGGMMIMPLANMPDILANSWRLKASNQMVLCIFYIVSYMRHTSNLELAIQFTAQHISPPLSLDLKKILWNVETEKFESIREALDAYLETWKKWNMEFVESMHLIESSLYESSEERRIHALEKSLSVILEETYEKMLHFAQELKSPITMLHMLGIILPILGLVILPLVVSFMENIAWYHIGMVYNIMLPAGVLYLGKTILSKRPTGYGQTDLTKANPDLKKLTRLNINIKGIKMSISPKLITSIIIIVFCIIGILPIILHSLDNQENTDYIINQYGRLKKIYTYKEAEGAKFSLLGYRASTKGEEIIGPFGLGASILSVFMIIGFGLGIGLYCKISTDRLIKIREKTKDLEGEFASALFQLGGRIGDGLPAELAFSKVSRMMKTTNAGKFFQAVSTNIENLGYGVEKAIFDKKIGALTNYPSNLIESSMKVFVESAKKGPRIASQTLINISLYIKEMHKVDERLKDLMAEIISSMKSQINFLTPAIAGIVIGITSMITSILGTLTVQMQAMSEDSAGSAAGGASSLLSMFSDGIPTYYFQIIVGIYVVQIIIILTSLINSIQNGVDPLFEKYLIGKNTMKGVFLYALICITVMTIFNMVAGMVVGGLNLT